MESNTESMWGIEEVSAWKAWKMQGGDAVYMPIFLSLLTCMMGPWAWLHYFEVHPMITPIADIVLDTDFFIQGFFLRNFDQPLFGRISHNMIMCDRSGSEKGKAGTKVESFGSLPGSSQIYPPFF